MVLNIYQAGSDLKEEASRQQVTDVQLSPASVHEKATSESNTKVQNVSLWLSAYPPGSNDVVRYLQA